MEIEKQIHLEEGTIEKNNAQEKEQDEEPADDSREPAEESGEEEDAMYSLTELQQEKLDLTDDVIGAMCDVFRTLDADGSGSLDVSELETAMASMGVECSKKEMETLIKQIDTDGNGSVDFFEFCGMVSEKMKDYDPEKEVKEAFDVFDKDGDGKVSMDEIQAVVESLGGDMSKEELDSMLLEADANSDGYIDYEEFVKIWMGEHAPNSPKNVDNGDSTKDDADVDEAESHHLTIPE